MDTESTTRIWPGPACLRTDNERDTRRYTAMVLDGYSPSHAFAMIMDERAEQRREVERRTRGIGEGRAIGRRRMERFNAWLLTLAAPQNEEALSPEHAMALWASDVRSCVVARHVARAAGGLWWRELFMSYDSAAPLIVERFLASPEWKALPWQRDPEVPRG